MTYNDKAIKNLSWIRLFIKNIITQKYLPLKIIYIYNYLCKLCEIKNSPSSDFEEKYNLMIKNIINFVTDYSRNHKINDLFKLKINKEITGPENIDNIL